MASVLSGRSVVVTRPRAQALPLILALRKLGARAEAMPLIRIDPPGDPRPLEAAVRGVRDGTARPDLLVFTSANAAEAFLDRLGRGRARRCLAGVRVLAVGPRTAAAVRKRGLRAESPDKDYRAEGLLARLKDVRGKAVLFPRAAKARELLPRELRRRGAKVRVVEAYRTALDRGQARRLKSALFGPKPADAVTFTSASTVESLSRLLGPRRLREAFERAAAVSIGPVTSAALRARGVRRVVEARPSTEAGLLKALKNHFRERRR